MPKYASASSTEANVPAQRETKPTLRHGDGLPPSALAGPRMGTMGSGGPNIVNLPEQRPLFRAILKQQPLRAVGKRRFALVVEGDVPDAVEGVIRPVLGDLVLELVTVLRPGQDG